MIAVVWSLCCPGAGQAVAGRRRGAYAWAALNLAAMLAAPLVVWATWGSLVFRLGALLGAIVALRRAPPAALLWTPPAIATTAAGAAALAFMSMFLEAFAIPSSGMAPTLATGDRVISESLTLAWRAPERGDIVVFEHPCQRENKYVKRIVAVGGDTVEVRCNVLYVNGAAVASEPVEGDSCRYEDEDEHSPGGALLEHPCSRYRETHGGRTYEVLHDKGRPERDARAKAGTLTEPDIKDFPLEDASPPSCPAFGGAAGAQPAGAIVETKFGSGPCEPQRHLVVPPGALFVMGDNRANSNDSRYWGLVPVSHVLRRVIGVYWPLARAGQR